MANKSIIKELETQVGLLVTDHKRLSRANAELLEQREKLWRERRELQQQVAELSSELSSLRLSEALSGRGIDNERARGRVNQLMREVDRCIALLNKVDHDEE
ncbi:MAG: hypothetical protein R3Y08_00395 [Rikenellaceae bacterium]